MNTVEKALMHALFVHLHHNIDKAIDFSLFKQLNQKIETCGRGPCWLARMPMTMPRWLIYRAQIAL